jgi:hypothetical protein
MSSFVSSFSNALALTAYDRYGGQGQLPFLSFITNSEASESFLEQSVSNHTRTSSARGRRKGQTTKSTVAGSLALGMGYSGAVHGFEVASISGVVCARCIWVVDAMFIETVL